MAPSLSLLAHQPNLCDLHTASVSTQAGWLCPAKPQFAVRCRLLRNIKFYGFEIERFRHRGMHFVLTVGYETYRNGRCIAGISDPHSILSCLVEIAIQHLQWFVIE